MSVFASISLIWQFSLPALQLNELHHCLFFSPFLHETLTTHPTHIHVRAHTFCEIHQIQSIVWTGSPPEIMTFLSSFVSHCYHFAQRVMGGTCSTGPLGL